MLLVRGLEQDSAGPAPPRHDLDGAAIAIVHDERIGAAAAERKLVIRADRQPRSAATTGRSGDRENFLDAERFVRRNPEGDDGAATGSPSRRRVGLEFSVPSIEYTLLDAVGSHV